MVDTVKLNVATAPEAVSSSDPLKNVNISAGANALGEGGWVEIQGGDATADDNNGGFASLQSGAGSGSGNGGGCSLTCGAGGPTGRGGNINIQSGAGEFPSGLGGNINIESGSGPGGAGSFLIVGGNGPNDNAEDGAGYDGGNIAITSGNGGHAFATNGDGGDGGLVTITLGDAGFKAGTGDDGFPGHLKIVGLQNFADDTAAATGGIPVNGLYRTASVIKIRVA